jgi:hypothetical protein
MVISLSWQYLPKKLIVRMTWLPVYPCDDRGRYVFWLLVCGLPPENRSK